MLLAVCTVQTPFLAPVLVLRNAALLLADRESAAAASTTTIHLALDVLSQELCLIN